MSTLAELRARVAADLKDSANATWSGDELDAHLRRALHSYSRINPRRQVGTLASSQDVREYALAGLSGLLTILDVWYPYDASAPQYPPQRPAWSRPYDGYLRLDVADAPTGAADEQLRIFYTVAHTIDDLDGASATTLDADGEGLVVLGATAYAAEQLAQNAIGKVSVSGWTPVNIQRWAAARMKAFEQALAELTQRVNQSLDPRTTWAGPI